MASEFTIIEFGNSAGVVVPRAVLKHYGLGIGDIFVASPETPGVLVLRSKKKSEVHEKEVL